MNSIRSSFSFSILIILLIISFSSKYASGAPLVKTCFDFYNPQVDRGYAANLNSLLSSLSSNANSSVNNSNNYGFYNSTAAGVGGLINVVNGLYLCRGDVNRDDCATCVQTASREILTECPNNKTAIVWYDNCLLRYSNQTGFPGTQWYMWNMQNATDPENFNNYMGNMMSNLATQASSDVSGKKFAVQEGNFSSFIKLFSLAQCIPIMSTTNCDVCLRGIIGELPRCCSGKQGGRILDPNCNIRFEIYPFYTPPTPAPAPAPAPVNNSSPTSIVTPPSPPNSPDTGGKNGISVPIIITIIVLSVVAAVILVVVVFICMRKRSKNRFVYEDDEQITTVESLNYSLIQVQNATNNFNEDHKIGEGGFGPVYKGTLPNGEEVAVKRLSKNSVQGLEEFKNEIVLLAKLQHRNLVRLLGFCFENQEKILIYEYFSNKSLDRFLFDSERRSVLGWEKRYKIIGGIARGLLYLHEDSRLRIIHRDLKASNVLLDGNMNAKIADFGTAKLFQVDQSEENTATIAGTYGYMAPEYVVYGQISVKSDVFSFGVLLLEIISGQKNNTFYQADGVDDLLSYAWKNFKNGNPLALLDPSVGELYATDDVIRCIHIGLLCVQEDAESRPTMASIVLMLSSNSVTMSIPLQPAFFATSHTRTRSMMQPRKPEESDTSTNKSSPHCVSGRDESFTELYPR